MIRLSIIVDDVGLVLQTYDRIKIYRADSEAGSYTEITDVTTRLIIEEEYTVYYYTDSDGDNTKWYKTSYFKEPSGPESLQSTARQGGTEEEKIGYSFKNYSSPSDVWGEVLTADDMRFTYLWGIDLQGSDTQVSDVSDTQLAWCIDASLSAFEKDFNIDIRKRIYKTDPDSALLQSVRWRQGVDYTNEEDWYDFSVIQWQNYGFLQLRHNPVISVEKAELYDRLGNKIMDVLDWVRLYKKTGQIHIYPKGSFSLGQGYGGASIFAAWHNMFGTNYPHSFKLDYTTGFKSSDFVPEDLRNAIGMYAAIIALGWIGDGLMAGFSSSSIGLDGLSESFSSTQSATSAYFGARILSYINQIKEFRKSNKYKYANIPIGFVKY